MSVAPLEKRFMAMFMIAIVLTTSPRIAEERPLDFSMVVDKIPLQAVEGPIYHQLLARAREKSPDALTKEAAEFLQKRITQADPRQKFSQFVDILKHSAEYRGQPVALRGRILRLVRYPALENEQDIEWLYEASLITDDAQGNSTTIVCLDKPTEIPLGEQLIGNVSVTGYFLKIHRVPARDKNERLYPLILAARFDVGPASLASPFWTKTLSKALAIAGIATAVFLAVQILRPRKRSASVPQDAPNPFL